MRWNRDGPHRAVVLLLLLTASFPAGTASEKRIAIYSPATNFSLPVVERNGRDYVGLLEILEPLGNVNSRSDGLHWKLRYNGAEAEFTNGNTRGKVRGHNVDLPADFLLESGRGMVPLSSLGTLLPPIMGGALTFNEASRRLFIGGVATHFTAQMNRTNPPRLVMNFTAPVNPTIATEPGKLLMSFAREPIVAPSSPMLTFDDKTIPSATYSESNGAAEIVVTGTAPLMASFSNDRRTITIAATPQQTAVAPAPQQVVPAVSSPAAPVVAVPPAVTAVVAPRHFYAVIDASHGGDDRGVAFSPELAEKDITLALARRLRQELEYRGISTLVLRDSDTYMNLDDRAVLTNTAHPVIYISMHAASGGRGVRLYTSLLPAGGENNGPFIAWDTAQARFLASSQAAAQGVAIELLKKQIVVRILAAPLRPLNNVTAAAIAVEVAPPDPDVMDLNLAGYQQNIAAGVADGIVAVRERLGASQ